MERSPGRGSSSFGSGPSFAGREGAWPEGFALPLLLAISVKTVGQFCSLKHRVITKKKKVKRKNIQFTLDKILSAFFSARDQSETDLLPSPLRPEAV